jgi:hypothetical protein
MKKLISIVFILCSVRLIAQNPIPVPSVYNNVFSNQNYQNASGIYNSTFFNNCFENITTVQMNAITTPKKGRIVFNTTTNSNWYFNGTIWVDMAASAGGLSGSGVAPRVPFYSGANTLTSTPEFTFDNTNKALTVGALNDNTARLTVNGAIKGNGNGGALLLLDGLNNQIFRGLLAQFGTALTNHTYFQMGSGNVALTGVNGVKMSKTAMLTDQFQISSGTNVNTPNPVGLFEIRDATNAYVNVLANGNVGIGTTSPSFPLDVQGANAGINILRSGGSDAFLRMQAGTTSSTISQVRSTSSGNINFTTNDVATRMTITQPGFVGIGTTTPTSQLSNTATQINSFNLQSASTATGLSWANTNIGWAGAFFSTSNGLNIKSSASTRANTILEVGSGTTSQTNLAGGSGSSPRFQIYGDGTASFFNNLGIKTQAPINSLSVQNLQYATGTASQTGNTITGVGTAWTSAMHGSQFIFQDASGNIVNAGTITSVNSATSITVTTSQTVASGNYQIQFTGLQATSTGTVGIGVATPASTLDIQNQLQATATVNTDAAMFTMRRPLNFNQKWDNIAQFKLGSYSTSINSNTKLNLFMNDGSSTGLTTVPTATFQANGTVGVNNNLPLSNLDVAGSFAPNLRTVTSTQTLLATDHTVIITGTFVTTQTLPTSVARRMIIIKNKSTGLATISGHIDGVAGSTYLLSTDNSITLQGDGTTWWIIDEPYRVSQIVNSGVDVTMDNFRIRLAAAGNRSAQISVATGTLLVNGNTTAYFTGVSSSTFNITATTTPQYLNAGFGFATAGNYQETVLRTPTNKLYRIVLQIGGGFNNNIITIERMN